MITPEQKDSANDLYRLIEKLVFDACRSVGVISKVCCEDIVVHFERDVQRLRELHDGQLHPSKWIGYLVFWVRKLKPVSSSFPVAKLVDISPTENVPDEDENFLVNEDVAIYLALHMIKSYAMDGYFPNSDHGLFLDNEGDHEPHARRTKEEKEEFVRKIELVVQELARQSMDAGYKIGNIFQSVVYDMRYRTFGPHHVVHTINHIVYSARLASFKGR